MPLITSNLLAVRVFAAASPPAIAVATIPAWGPPVVALFGINVPIGSTVLALLGVMMARGVSAAREGRSPGEHYVTGVLILITIGAVLNQQPGPGMAVSWGVGIGASGTVVVDLLKTRVTAAINAMLGKDAP